MFEAMLPVTEQFLMQMLKREIHVLGVYLIKHSLPEGRYSHI